MPYLDDRCNLADQKGWSINFNTSGIKYSQKLAEKLARNPKSNLCVALDSWTEEIYEKIKRVKTFDKVVENLHKYHEARMKIFLKYILIPELMTIWKILIILLITGTENVMLSQNMSHFEDDVKHAEDP